MSNKVGSLFSGIGGMDKGLQDAGWEITWQVEIDRWCRRVLAARFPGATQYGDIREKRDYSPVDLLSFGFPCTNLSVAGKREGLGGDESRLFWAAMVIARRLKPPWLLVENVPGLLSSHQGRDFGLVLGALAHLGYWWSYRVLDSQYLGVPQRRRRVYIVGHLGGPVPPEILFEPVGVSGNHPARGRSRPRVAGAVTSSAGHHGHSSPQGDGSDTLISGAITSRTGRHNESSYALAAHHSRYNHESTYVVNGRQDPVRAEDKSLPIDASRPAHAVAQPLRANRWGGSDSHGDEGNVVVAPTLSPGAHPGGVTGREAANGAIVVGPDNHRSGRAWHALDQARALNEGGGPGATPGYVVSYAINASQERHIRNAWNTTYVSEEADADGVRTAPGTTRRVDLSMFCQCKDSPRYRGLGNGVTATVAEWIGRRILKCAT